jgi:cytochrome d ubiquinol oxidase subunit II
VVTVETWHVRPDLFGSLWRRPYAWPAIIISVTGVVAIFFGIRHHRESRAFAGSCLVIAGLFSGAAAVLFPVLMYSTLDPESTLTAYNSSASRHGLAVALVWWPAALVLALAYAGFVSRHYAGKVPPPQEPVDKPQRY